MSMKNNRTLLVGSELANTPKISLSSLVSELDVAIKDMKPSVQELVDYWVSKGNKVIFIRVGTTSYKLQVLDYVAELSRLEYKDNEKTSTTLLSSMTTGNHGFTTYESELITIVLNEIMDIW